MKKRKTYYEKLLVIFPPQIAKIISEGYKEKTNCGQPHNNGDETCLECEIIKANV